MSALSPWEIKSLLEIEAKWYDSFYSIIFTPPGEIPQSKGPWTDGDFVVSMLDDLKIEYPDLKMIVVSSRSGYIHAEDAEEWRMSRRSGMECAKDEVAYLEAGVCAQCGACNAKEAEKKCRPTPLGDTGDYSCDGDRLWQKDEPVRRNFYIASKVKHAPAWLAIRRTDVYVVSSWIREAGEGATKSYAELGPRCLSEIAVCDALILYCEPGEILKGALIEAGTALALGKPVRCVGTCLNLSRVFREHPLWSEFPTMEAAFDA